jgi:hypothetical protein
VCIWEETQNLRTNRITRFQTAALFPSEKIWFHGGRKTAFGLESGDLLMEAGARTHFTYPESENNSSLLGFAWLTQRREMYGTDQKTQFCLPSLTLHVLGAGDTVWTNNNNNNQSPYSFRERFLVIFQNASSSLTYSICLPTHRPQPQQQK